MGVLVMMWDIQDENNNNITSNNNYNNKGSLRVQVFHWPQHSFLIEHFRDHGATLGAGLREKLQKLDIYTRSRPPGASKAGSLLLRGAAGWRPARGSGSRSTSSWRATGRGWSPTPTPASSGRRRGGRRARRKASLLTGMRMGRSHPRTTGTRTKCSRRKT